MKYWTTAEEDLLRKVWDYPESCKHLQQDYFPDRSPDSLRVRAARMGLTRGKKYRREPTMLPWLVWSALSTPASALEICERIGLSTRAPELYEILHILHKQARVIHILKWKRKKAGKWYKVWARGETLDALPPKKNGCIELLVPKGYRALAGNPFAGLLVEFHDDNAERSPNVCTR